MPHANGSNVPDLAFRRRPLSAAQPSNSCAQLRTVRSLIRCERLADKQMFSPERGRRDKTTASGEYMNHYVEERETEMLPKSRDRDLDLKAPGVELAGRKAELMEGLAIADERQSWPEFHAPPWKSEK